MSTKAPTAVESAAREHRSALVELLMCEKVCKRVQDDPDAYDGSMRELSDRLTFARNAVQRTLETYNDAVRSEISTVGT